MTAVCTCRICKSQYSSLLVATACCLTEKLASRRRKTTDSILKTGEKSVSIQSKITRRDQLEQEWQILVSELGLQGKSY